MAVLLLAVLLAVLSPAAVGAAPPRVYITAKPAPVDTWQEPEGAEAQPFDRSDVCLASLARRRWLQTLDAQLENLTNTYGFEPGWWARFEALGPLGPRCGLLERFGDGDSEKRVCGLRAALRAQQRAGVGCRILSIGSNNQWSFEEAVVGSTNCSVDTFDCTRSVKDTWAVPAAIAHRVTLHEKCLGHADEMVGTREFITYPKMLALAGIESSPDFLKMDIEERLSSPVDRLLALGPEHIFSSSAPHCRAGSTRCFALLSMPSSCFPIRSRLSFTTQTGTAPARHECFVMST